MRARLTLLLLFLSLCIAGVAIADPPALRKVLLGRPAGSSGVAVLPERYLRPWDPITLFFPGEPGRAGGGPEDRPERFVDLEPAHPGAWTWIDGHTLQFRPIEPWPPLLRPQLEVKGEVFELVSLLNPPYSTEPAEGATLQPPTRDITLRFTGAVDVERLEQSLQIWLRPILAGQGQDQRLDDRDFDLKLLHRMSAGHPSTVVVTLEEAIPLGMEVELRLRELPEDAPEQQSHLLRFSTAPLFTPTRLSCGSASAALLPGGSEAGPERRLDCAGDDRVMVDFSVAVSPKAGPIEARNLLRFDPSVPELQTEWSGSRLIARGRFQPLTTYEVRVVPTELRSADDRPLLATDENILHLRFLPAEPMIQWTREQGIVERLGPQLFPMRGRAMSRLDLRFHRIDPLDRSFWPWTEGEISTDDDEAPPWPEQEVGPHADPERDIWHSEIEAQLRELGAPSLSRIVDLPLGEGGGTATFGLDLAPHLAHVAGEGAPGTWLIGMRPLHGQQRRQWVRVQVTDLSLTAVEEADAVRFVVSSLHTGQPVSGARLQLDGYLSDEDGARAWKSEQIGQTDARGVLRWQAPGRPAEGSFELRRIGVNKGDDWLVLDVLQSPDVYADNLWQEPEDEWLAWAWQELAGGQAQEQLRLHLWTERPVYRPEEPIHAQGLLRRRSAGRLQPSPGSATLLLRAPDGEEVGRYPLTIDQTGSFYQKVEGDPERPTGRYSLELLNADGDLIGEERSIQVAAYRVPSFEVNLEAPRQAPVDRPFTVSATARPYAGGQLGERPLRWRVTAFPAAWTPPTRPGFVFASDGRYTDAARQDTQPRVDEERQTSADGSASLQIDPTAEADAAPRTYVVEATVVGSDDQPVSAVAEVLALPPFVIGARMERYLPEATEARPELLVVDAQGQPIAGQELSVRLLHRQWHSHLQASDFAAGEARYVTEVVDEPVLEQRLTSLASPLALPLRLPRAGVYILEVSARDRVGRAQVLKVDFYAGGEAPQSWEKPAAATFELSPDQARYQPGQTAHILLRSPYQEARALVIVEAPEGNRYSWLDLRRGAATVDLPIDKSLAPNVPVHVVLMRGRQGEARPDERLDLGRPTTLAASVQIQVEPTEQQIQVKLEHPPKVLPGQSMPVTVKLSDARGRPLAGQVALWLVDAAVLSLGPEQRLDPLPDLLLPVPMRARLRDTRNLVLGRIPYALVPGGDGEGAEDSPFPPSTVRRNFQSVPYYNPRVEVGASGQTTVQVKLSDDLTIFRMRAKAWSGEDRFGVGRSDLLVRLPVVIQPVLPRFVRLGDRFEAGALARVTEGGGGPAAVMLKTEGLEQSGPARKEVVLDSQGPTEAAWTLRVQASELDLQGQPLRSHVQVAMGLNRQSDGSADGVVLQLPLRADREREQRLRYHSLEAGASLALQDPADLRPGTLSRNLAAATDPDMLRLVAAFDQLQRGGDLRRGLHTELALSQARALLALGSLRRQWAPELDEAALRAQVEATLALLPTVTDRDGLIAQWPGGRGTVSLTADAALFAAEARAMGHAIDPQWLATLSRSLRLALRSDYRRFLDGEAQTERAQALLGLAALGQLDPAYAAELARLATFQEADAAAATLAALSAQEGADPATLARLVDLLASGVSTRLEGGQERYQGLQARRSARSPLILASEARTIGAMLSAIGRAAPQHRLVGPLRQALLQSATPEGWGDSRANAEALLALLATRSPQGRPASLQLGSQTLQLPADGSPLLQSRVSVTRLQAQGGPIGLRVAEAWLPALPGAEQEAQSDGIVVQRSLFRLGAGPAERLTEQQGALHLQVGDLVEELVQLTLPRDLSHVQVRLPIAAGLELLNPELATASTEARPSRGSTRAPSATRLADDEAVWSYDLLPRGTYELLVRARATVPGRYNQPPASARPLYTPGQSGRSEGSWVVVSAGQGHAQ